MPAALIKQNPASYAITLGSIVFAIFFSTFGGALVIPAIIMYMLGFSSLIFADKFHASGEEPEPTGRKGQTIAILFLSGLMTFLILNLFIPEISFLAGGQTVTVTTFIGQNALVIGAIYSSTWIAAFFFSVFVVPPNEEQFFRVMIGNIVSKYSGGNPLFFMVQVPIVGAVPVVVMLVVGTVFATFHLAVYSLNYTTLTILWGAGSMLYYFDLRAGDPLPSVFAHMGNNALAFLYQGNILAISFPSIAQYQPLPTAFLPLLQVLPVLGMALYVKYGKQRPLWGLP